jgi:drug/metabolite transporter (DMT)-like permease
MARTTTRGVVLMLCANLVFCIMACLVKQTSGCSAWTTTLFRFLMGIGIVSIFAISGRVKLRFVNSRGLFLRGLMGGSATAIFFYSLTKTGLVRTGFIVSLYPAFATMFGAILLKEQLSGKKILALLGALMGVVVLMYDRNAAGGPFSGIDRFELLALFGSLLAGLTVVSIKKLQSTDSTVAIFFAQCLVGAFIVFVPASITASALPPGALAALLLIGILATVGQLLSTDSYRYLSVASGSILVMTTPVLNCIAGLLFFHEPMSLQSGIGAVVILGSSAGLLLDKG